MSEADSHSDSNVCVVESELARLREDNARLERYWACTPNAIIELDDQWRIQDCNSAAEKTFSIDALQLRGQRVDETLLASLSAAEVGQLLQGRGLRRNAYHRLGSGKVIIAEWTVMAGSGGGLTAYIADVTQQREALSALVRREQEQLEILNAMADAAITINDRGVILTFNEAAVKMFGYGEREVIGKKVNCLMPEHMADRHDEFIDNYLRTGEAKVIGQGREVEGLQRDGDRFPLRLSVSELPRSDQGGRRFLGICHDLSESKEQERRLFRSQKMEALGKLTGGIAHDFNNILGIINGYTSLLEDELDDEELERYVREIDRAAGRGAKLTQRLLYLSKHREMSKSSVNVGEVVESMQYVLSRTMTPSVNVHIDIDDGDSPVHINGDFLEDAILNLCINAMHAMPEGGELTIRTRSRVQVQPAQAECYEARPGQYVTLAVQDSGSGIAPESLDKIFDPFFSTKGSQGTGLGLSQVYGFVRQMGGFVEVNSTLGEGSVFTLFFPVTESAHAPLPGEDKSIQPLPGGRETLLIVDDEQAMLDINATALRKAGYTVFTSADADEALEILAQLPVDLMISDVIMPNLNGFKLAQKAQELRPDLKVQMISGYEGGQEQDADESLKAGILRKPYGREKLLQTIRQALDSR